MYFRGQRDSGEGLVGRNSLSFWIPHQVRNDMGRDTGMAPRKRGNNDTEGKVLDSRSPFARGQVARQCQRRGKALICSGQWVRHTASLRGGSGRPARSARRTTRRPHAKTGEDPSRAPAAAFGAGSLGVAFLQATAKLELVTTARTLVFIDWHHYHHPSSSHLITCFIAETTAAASSSGFCEPNSIRLPSESSSRTPRLPLTL